MKYNSLIRNVWKVIKGWLGRVWMYKGLIGDDYGVFGSDWKRLECLKSNWGMIRIEIKED